MNILFRCDSSISTGSGHLMRCLAVATQLRDLGHEIYFVCKPLVGSLHNKIVELGFSLKLLSGEDISEKLDAHETSSFVGTLSGKPLLIVDHYGLSQKWEADLHHQCVIVAIDDLGRVHQCAGLIDANFRLSYDLYEGKVPAKCQSFLGPQYSILREEFRLPVHASKEKKGVLVFFGGMDEYNETGRFIAALQDIEGHTHFSIVISSAHRFIKDLQSLPFSDRYTLYFQPPHLADLMRQARLFFGSGGTVTWERMAVGLPGVVMAVADNQVKIAADLAQAGHQVYLGRRDQVSYPQALEKIEQLLDQPDWLDATAKKNRDLVSTINMQEVLAKLQLVGLRPAVAEDAKYLYDLRNDPLVREVSVSAVEFTFEDHLKWFSRKLNSKCELFIILRGQESAGQIRVDEDFMVSLAIDPHHRGYGVAAEAINLAVTRHFLRAGFDSAEYTALIKPSNIASIRSFEKAGFSFKESILTDNIELNKYIRTCSRPVGKVV